MASQASVEVFCRSDGTLIEVIHDELGLTPYWQPGTSLTSIVEPGSLSDATCLLSEIRENRLALDVRLGIALERTAVTLFLFGFRTDRGIHLIGAREPITRESLFHELTKLADQSSHGQRISGSDPESQPDLSWDAVLAITAHDLRNHLNGILAASQYLLDDAATLLETEHATLLRSIESSSRAMFRVIEDFLSVSTTEPANTRLHLKPINVLTLIKKNLSRSRLRPDRKNVRLKSVPADTVPRIVADPVRINRVLDTLLTKIIDSSSTGSKIELSVAAKDRLVMISVWAERTTLSAVGLKSIFHPNPGDFTGLKAGTLLAFRLMSQIIEEHGGSIHVEGEAGTGLTITLSLPISGKQAAELPEKGQSA